MLLDTSGLYSYFDEDDSFHARAVEYFDASDSMLVNDYVLAEFIPLGQVRALNRRKTLAFVEEILASPFIEKVWTTQNHYTQALRLLKQRRDKTYSLCDAASFLLMRRHARHRSLNNRQTFRSGRFYSPAQVNQGSNRKSTKLKPNFALLPMC